MNLLTLVEKRNEELALQWRKDKDGDNFNDVPTFKSGDTVAVYVRVVEGEKERIQKYQGIVIEVKGGGINKTFRVRKISNGVGVERIFPVHSPMIQKIEVLRQGKARRSKLYYLRGMSDKKIRAKLS
ncbi:MAG: 50S ribosomal protein L19 [Candidatus Kapaibacteriales bacterium]